MPAYDVVLKKVEPQMVVSVRGTVPSYGEQGQLWGELDAFLGRAGVNPVGPCLAIYHDPEYRERDVDVEACEPVAAKVTGDGRVTSRELPGVEMAACVIHHGPFSGLGQAYDALMKWIASNSYRVVGANREVYLRAPADPNLAGTYPSEFLTTNPNDCVTEIQFPVEKA